MRRAEAAVRQAECRTDETGEHRLCGLAPHTPRGVEGDFGEKRTRFAAVHQETPEASA
jgi:Tfp pilus assembly protein PilX